MDLDYVEVLEYGLPSTDGMGIDRLVDKNLFKM